MKKFVYFVRHGQSQTNAENKYGGQLDSPLTELGRQQAKEAAQMLKDISFDKVFCSDLSRAKETAAIILPHVTPQYTKQIREVSIGHLEGMLRSECIQTYGDLFLNATHTRDYSPFGGESYETFSARVKAFIKFLESDTDSKTVAVFCHGGFISETFRQTLGCFISPQIIPLHNCSVSVFAYIDNVWSLQTYNRTTKLVCK